MTRFLLAVLLAIPAASAQPATETWIGANAGFENGPLIYGVGTHLTTGRRVSARIGYDHANEFTILGATPSTLNAVSLSASVRHRGGRSAFSAFAGPSYVWGRGPFESSQDRPSRQPYKTFGLALGGQAVYELHPRFGVGLEVTGNMNPGLSSMGARLGLHVRAN